MLVKIEFGSTAPDEEVINLCDYGHSLTTKWDDLSDEEQNQIKDSLSEKYFVVAGGEGIPCEEYTQEYLEHYNEEELSEINDALFNGND